MKRIKNLLLCMLFFSTFACSAAFALDYACFTDDTNFEVVDVTKKANYSNCKPIYNTQHKLKAASCYVSYFTDDKGVKRSTQINCRGTKEDLDILSPQVRSMYK